MWYKQFELLSLFYGERERLMSEVSAFLTICIELASHVWMSVLTCFTWYFLSNWPCSIIHSKHTPIPVLLSKFLTFRIRSDVLPITKSVANPFLLAFVQVMFDNCYSSLFFIENGAVIVLGNDCH